MAKKLGSQSSPATRARGDWKSAFIASLEAHPNVTHAARVAGVSRRGAYKARDTDEEFAERWEDALNLSLDNLEQEIYRRAHLGVEKPIVQGGKIITHVREYSDTLAMFILRAHRPAMYREQKIDITIPTLPPPPDYKAIQKRITKGSDQ